jgi:uncharacterized protein (TIGR02145 family)
MRKQFSKLALVATLGLALTFIFSCSSDDGSGGSNTPLKKDKIIGFIQKGPFVKGSDITLFELNKELVQTGKSLNSSIENDEGSFEIKSVSLVSPYVRLKADGYYYNEVSGKKSNSQITLYAIADLTNKNSLNVNLLTHLEYEKVQKLVEEGKSLSEAKKQTQKDILKIFGIYGDFANSEDMSIFGSSDGSAVLLAISILLQGERNEASFTDLLADFKQSIKNSGEWSIAKKTELADWASGTDLERIRANINGWGLHYEVPIFEKYIRKFWSDNYGLGECKPADNGHTAKNANPLSVNKNSSYVCNGSYWESTEKVTSSSSGGSEILSSSSKESEINYANIQRLEVGGSRNISLGSFVDLDGGVAYLQSQARNNASKIDIVYLQDRINAYWDALDIWGSLIAPLSAFVDAATVTKSYNILTGVTPLTKDWENTMVPIKNMLYDDVDYIIPTVGNVFVALTEEGNLFVIAITAIDSQSDRMSIAYLPIKSSSSIGSNNNSSSSVSGGYTGVYGSVEHCGQTYKTVVIGTQTWFAENVNCSTASRKCYDDDPTNCYKYGSLYNWVTAKTVCPTGWHLPNNTEWEKLIIYAGGITIAGKLKATNGWNNDNGKSGNGTDELGFSALPGGYYYPDDFEDGKFYPGKFDDIGDYATWWSATESNADVAYDRRIYNDGSEELEWGNKLKSFFRSVRCVKN